MYRLSLMCLVMVFVVATCGHAQETPPGDGEQEQELKKAQVLFAKIAGDKTYIVISDLPAGFRRYLDSFARREGITNGKLTKKQFLKFATKRRPTFGPFPFRRPREGQLAIVDSIFQGKKTLAMKKVPVFYKSALQQYLKSKGKKTDRVTRADFLTYLDFWQKQSDLRRATKQPLTLKEFNARVARLLDGYFTGRDRNKDGFLDQVEMSDRLKENLKQFDKNGDGKIDLPEARVYIRGHAVIRYGEPKGDKK